MTSKPTATSNAEQSRFWNEQGGPRWVTMEGALDAQLEPLGVAVADRLALRPGQRVLDVGCGAGATSLMLAERVKPGSVVGVDISRPLVERARERGAGRPNLRFEVADAQTFAFAPASFEIAFSRFGVMFFDDPVAAFANVHAALTPGGTFGFVCWRAMRENPSFTLPLQAGLPFLAEAPAPPDPNAPGPFAFADADRLRTLLQGGGFSVVDIVRHDTHITVAGRADLEAAVDLAVHVGPLARALPDLDEARRAKLRDAVGAAFAPYHGRLGVVLPAATWLVTARRVA